jgi:hypothetical protein
MKQTKHLIKSHRYELVHGEDADFIAYQRRFAMAVGRRFQRG